MRRTLQIFKIYTPQIKNRKRKIMAKDTKFTKENASEMGKRGAIKSAEVRRRNKELKNTAQNILQMGLKKGGIDEFDCIEESIGKNLTVAEQIFIKQVAKALKGDRQAAEFCYNYGGMKPAEKREYDIDTTIGVEENELTNLAQIMSEFKQEQLDENNAKKDQ
jgi:hypothetical protein